MQSTWNIVLYVCAIIIGSNTFRYCLAHNKCSVKFSNNCCCYYDYYYCYYYYCYYYHYYFARAWGETGTLFCRGNFKLFFEALPCGNLFGSLGRGLDLKRSLENI